MQNARNVLTPQTLEMLQAIAETGSFAAAARAMGMVPSALTYRVRQLEDALDVLLYDRSSRQAQPTQAGAELLREGKRLLGDIDAMANRVQRVATGWEPQLTIALDTIITRSTVLELCEKFYALQPPTHIRLREEALAGTLETLRRGQTDLAIGINASAHTERDIHTKALGAVSFVYAVAPHHPLARAPEPLDDATIAQHRVVAVADSARHSDSLTFGILGGQDVFTVSSMQAKLEAQIRGLGGGNLPLCIAQRHIDAGQLVVKRTERPKRQAHMHYAWRAQPHSPPGRALAWWLQQLESPTTRNALLGGPGTGAAA